MTAKSRKTAKIVVWSVVTLALLAVAAESLGCPVCFGESDDPIIKGLEASVLFMVGVTYFLIIGGVATFFLLRRRARRLAEQADPGYGSTAGSTG